LSKGQLLPGRNKWLKSREKPPDRLSIFEAAPIPHAVNEALEMKSILLATATLLGLAGSAFAADAVNVEPAPVPLPVASTYNWAGAYVGAQVGYGWGRDSIHDERRSNGSSDWNDRFSLPARWVGFTRATTIKSTT
jgi:outer membrane immunogenic protein